MRGVNKCILIGNVGRDPETRYSGAGLAITNISVATSESWKDKQTGEQKEKTEWHNVVFFGRLAEIAGEYLVKGSQVYIEGKLRTESYEKDGVTKYVTKIHADELQMLGGRPEGDGGAQRSGGGGQQRSGGQPQGRPAGGGQGQGRGGAPQQRQAPAQQTGFDDDDIPF